MSTALSYDRYQFQGRSAHPVHTNFIAGEAESSGISYQDYGRMHVENHRASERKLAAPAWAFNDSQLRELLCVHLELRAGLRSAQSGTHAERLARATAALARGVPTMTATLRKMCHEYSELKRAAPQHPRLRTLEIEIQNLDAQICFTKRPAEIILGIVQRYYRQNLDSPTTAHALGIKPPNVRQTLWRLRRTWSRMQDGTAWLSGSASNTGRAQ